MKKKILKISAFVAALVLVVIVGFFACAFLGNPVSKALATKTAKEYVAETYAGTDYEIEDVSYSFKDSNYYAHIVSPSSKDTYFSLVIGLNGKLIYDNYETYVADGFNTEQRLDKEYRELTDTVLESKTFPCKIDFAFGELETHLLEEEFEIDGIYDINKLGAEAGRIALYVYDDEVSAQRMAEVLLDVREAFDKAGVSFNKIDCTIQLEADEPGIGREEICVRDILYSDINEEGLVERVIENYEAISEEDAKSLKEGIL